VARPDLHWSRHEVSPPPSGKSRAIFCGRAVPISGGFGVRLNRSSSHLPAYRPQRDGCLAVAVRTSESDTYRQAVRGLPPALTSRSHRCAFDWCSSSCGTPLRASTSGKVNSPKVPEEKFSRSHQCLEMRSALADWHNALQWKVSPLHRAGGRRKASMAQSLQRRTEPAGQNLPGRRRGTGR